MMKFIKVLFIVLMSCLFVLPTKAKASGEDNLSIQFLPNTTSQVKVIGKFDEGPDCPLNSNYYIQSNDKDKVLLNNCRRSIDDQESDGDIAYYYYLQVVADQKNNRCVWAKLMLQKVKSLEVYGRNSTSISWEQSHQVNNTYLGSKQNCRE